MNIDRPYEIDSSLLDIFQLEVDSQRDALTTALLRLAENPVSVESLEQVMRAAHSLKGAARLVSRQDLVNLAHAMEELVIKAQKGVTSMDVQSCDALQQACDLFCETARLKEVPEDLLLSNQSLCKVLESIGLPGCSVRTIEPPKPSNAAFVPAPTIMAKQESEQSTESSFLRVDSTHMDRLLGLASETLVNSSWNVDIAGRFEGLKKEHAEYAGFLQEIAEQSQDSVLLARSLQKKFSDIEALTQQLVEEIQRHTNSSTTIAAQLYQEVLGGRMRPVNDILSSLQRLTRTVSKALGKRVSFHASGQNTLVDREVLRQIEGPLQQIIKNSIDHGLETTDERKNRNKSPEGSIIIEARSTARMLYLNVRDDGRGIDLERIRECIIKQRLSAADTVERMTDAELYEFIFLPGFSVRETVSEFSGRGVGLDIVQAKVRGMGGSIKVSSEPGVGVNFEIALPISRAVTKALVFRAAEGLFGIPLNDLCAAVKVEKNSLRFIAGRPYFTWNNSNIGLTNCSELLELQPIQQDPNKILNILIFEQMNEVYGIVVDEILGQSELLLQNMDARLGQVNNVSAVSLMQNGEVVVILNTEDLAFSVNRLFQSRSPDAQNNQAGQDILRKRILVVDDSMTVRELERRLLQSAGYEVQVAVDGLDGWKQIGSGQFDLIVTDIDMPRMNGIELVKLIREHETTIRKPIVIVSYKERSEDRLLGLSAGADYYLTKGSFHDESFLTAIGDLIGDSVK